MWSRCAFVLAMMDIFESSEVITGMSFRGAFFFNPQDSFYLHSWCQENACFGKVSTAQASAHFRQWLNRITPPQATHYSLKIKNSRLKSCNLAL